MCKTDNAVYQDGRVINFFANVPRIVHSRDSGKNQVSLKLHYMMFSFWENNVEMKREGNEARRTVR